jgi:hypothetical protein
VAESPPAGPGLPADPHRLPPPGEWFAGDAERHLLDRPRFCPMCGASLDGGLVSESWAADQRIFLTWCAGCSWLGEVVRFERVAISEAEH